MVTSAPNNLFHQLAREELEALCKTAEERSFPAEHDIFKEGEDGDGVYVVKNGEVRISVSITPEARSIFSRVGAGEIFGEMAVLENKPRSATATAVADTTVYFIPKAAMLQLVEHSAAFSFFLLQEISHRLREFNRHYIREVLQTERLSIVGRFAGSIVHDLKNPLSVISLSAEIVRSDEIPEPKRRVASQRIQKQVERITDMVNEILAFTRGSQKPLPLARMNYADYVRALIEEIRPEVKSRLVEVEMADVPPANVLLNPQRLRRLFDNLFRNAMDAMPHGGKILLRFQQTGGEITTEFEDSGPGIAPEIAGRLFEAFSTFGKVHGTGLGLSICKKIVEDHNGRITAFNRPGGGAVFAFTLPLAK